jgi:tricorn protease-like protein
VFTTDGRDITPTPSDVVLEASKLVSPTLADALKGQSALMNKGASLALIMPSEIRELDPMPGSEYINAALSPDGTRIVFEVLGGGMHVLNLETGAIVDLGVGNRPVWSPALNRIAFMVAEDDGYTYTSSDIYVINADGTGRRKLSTTTSLMEMNPSWSPDGTRIAFDVYATGDVYIITIDPS